MSIFILFQFAQLIVPYRGGFFFVMGGRSFLDFWEKKAVNYSHSATSQRSVFRYLVVMIRLANSKFTVTLYLLQSYRRFVFESF